MGNRSSSFDVLGIVALVVVLALVAWRLQGSGGQAPIVRDTPMPPLNVEGWLNLPEGQTSFDPSGKVVVVDLWATWCVPCRQEMPRLAEVVRQYRPLGVEFIGLTSETERDRERIEDFIADTEGFDWLVGYGAIEFWNALGVRGIPTVIVFGRDGRVRWSVAGAGQSGLEEALDEALAAEPAEAGAARD
jgi:thiol-disulfide isomerase/thioredoxin